MATRALIRITPREEGVSFSEHPKQCQTEIYHHYDGYPQYLGRRLAEMLGEVKVVNGISSREYLGGENLTTMAARPILQANGISCLAASVVSELKTECGQVYLEMPNDELDKTWIDFTYYVWVKVGEPIWISIFDHSGEGCIFVGTCDKLLEKYSDEI